MAIFVEIVGISSLIGRWLGMIMQNGDGYVKICKTEL